MAQQHLFDSTEEQIGPVRILGQGRLLSNLPHHEQVEFVQQYSMKSPPRQPNLPPPKRRPLFPPAWPVALFPSLFRAEHPLPAMLAIGIIVIVAS